LTVNIASEMHCSALRSLTQPCMTAYCICHNIYGPGISPGSANQCILGDVYLRSNLSRKQKLLRQSIVRHPENMT